MVQELGDMTAALDLADASDMRELYEVLDLQVSCNQETRSAEIATSPALHGFSVGVRGGIRTLTTRVQLSGDGVRRRTYSCHSPR